MNRGIDEALDLTEEERTALIRLPHQTLDDARYPMAPRLDPLKAILAKLMPPLQPANAAPSQAAMTTYSIKRGLIRLWVFLAAVLCLCFLTLAIMSSTSASAADLSNAELTKACQRKNIIVNSKGEQVGEDIDDLCAGYLRGVLYTLLATPNVKCTSEIVTEQTPDDLLSVYLRYLKDKNTAASDAAASTLLSAYRRAFDCEAK